MSLRLSLVMAMGAIFLFCLATYFLKKGRIPEKYTLLWYTFSLIILLLSIFPGVMTSLAKLFGFEIPSNMLMLALIALLFLLVMVLTIMVAGQKKKTTLLIQEISLIKSSINKK